MECLYTMSGSVPLRLRLEAEESPYPSGGPVSLCCVTNSMRLLASMLMSTWRVVLAVGLASGKKGSVAGTTDGGFARRLRVSRYSSASGSLRAAISSREESLARGSARVSDTISKNRYGIPYSSFAKSLLHTVQSFLQLKGLVFSKTN